MRQVFEAMYARKKLARMSSSAKISRTVPMRVEIAVVLKVLKQGRCGDRVEHTGAKSPPRPRRPLVIVLGLFPRGLATQRPAFSMIKPARAGVKLGKLESHARARL